ncbi:MAG: acetate/propionate family kinase [Pseudomonadota bacterium]|nr:acetate/propionate family kinase [Pseudomonadota bacterium]
MYILVVNAGSSSLKADLLDPATGARAARVRVERIGAAAATVRWGDDAPEGVAIADHPAALRAVLPRLLEVGRPVAVGHRVVHGGERFTAPTLVDDTVEAAIEALTPLAPLHNPANLAGIRAARALLPDVPHVAVFDTAFHATLPRRARTYALSQERAEKHGIRRFGFHGTSHAFVARRAADWLGEDVRDLRIVTLHLGNGCSAAAVEYGRSVETSMGMTPLEGLVMGTRGGDIDPGALIALARAEGLDLDGLDALLNREGGLAGLSGVGNDLRDIEQRAAAGDERCRLAMLVFAHRARKYVGAYAAVMGGMEALVFTAGIGENSVQIRQHVAQRLDFLGARLDEDKNRGARVSDASPVVEISADHSRVRILVVQTDEERAIAEEVAALAGQDVSHEDAIPIAISARHLHLTQAAVEILFGVGHTLTVHKMISQPGQFAAEEKVTLIGPRRSIEGVRVLGPTRRACQVEVSRTDEFFLGLDAPIRDSGDVANSPGLTLEGPAGRLTLGEGLICARRHIHMAPEDAARFGVADRDVVEVAVDSDGRDLVFRDVLVRVSPSFVLEMHVDTDEANAAELSPGATGALEGTGRHARLLRRHTGFDRTAGSRSP